MACSSTAAAAAEQGPGSRADRSPRRARPPFRCAGRRMNRIWIWQWPAHRPRRNIRQATPGSDSGCRVHGGRPSSDGADGAPSCPRLSGTRRNRPPPADPSQDVGAQNGPTRRSRRSACPTGLSADSGRNGSATTAACRQAGFEPSPSQMCATPPPTCRSTRDSSRGAWCAKRHATYCWLAIDVSRCQAALREAAHAASSAAKPRSREVEVRVIALRSGAVRSSPDRKAVPSRARNRAPSCAASTTA
jgi:hypothetical protein